MREIKNREETFTCQCTGLDHQFTFRLWDDEEFQYTLLSLEPLLNFGLSWWRRVIVATKYVFGFKSRFGPFDDILIKDEDIPRIESILNEYKEKKCSRN